MVVFSPRDSDSSAGRSPLASGTRRGGDRLYDALLIGAAALIFVLIVAIAVALWWQSRPSLHALGLGFVTGVEWNEVEEKFGIWPFLFGTLYSSLIALLLATPISLGAAIFLSELAPKWLRTPLTFLIELLAAIPSVVYGLWGIFLLTPFLRDRVMQPLSQSEGLAKVPVLGTLLSGAAFGPSMLAAGVILAIMVCPFITAVTRDLLRAIPKAQREASYGIGATQWETIRNVVLPYARSGIVGAVMLGLGRALGETMAVTMLIGNQTPATPSGTSLALFDPGYTMASALANKFTEATPGLNTAALIEIGLVLFVVAVVINSGARLLVRLTARRIA